MFPRRSLKVCWPSSSQLPPPSVRRSVRGQVFKSEDLTPALGGPTFHKLIQHKTILRVRFSTSHLRERLMITVHAYPESVHVPVWVHDLESFRRWMHSDESPEKVPVYFLHGEVWLDMSQEQIFSQVLIKSEFTAVLRTLTKKLRLGTFLPDGLLLTNDNADM